MRRRHEEGNQEGAKGVFRGAMAVVVGNLPCHRQLQKCIRKVGSRVTELNKGISILNLF